MVRVLRTFFAGGETSAVKIRLLLNIDIIFFQAGTFFGRHNKKKVDYPAAWRCGYCKAQNVFQHPERFNDLLS